VEPARTLYRSRPLFLWPVGQFQVEMGVDLGLVGGVCLAEDVEVFAQSGDEAGNFVAAHAGAAGGLAELGRGLGAPGTSDAPMLNRLSEQRRHRPSMEGTCGSRSSASLRCARNTRDLTVPTAIPSRAAISE
jgi:hypothetical protein